MATGTLGTAAQTTATSLALTNAMSDADIATINALIKGDAGPSTSPVGSGYLLPQQCFTRNGQLFLPGRMGWIQWLPGDFIAVLPTKGWPILISGAAAGSADIVHT